MTSYSKSEFALNLIGTVSLTTQFGRADYPKRAICQYMAVNKPKQAGNLREMKREEGEEDEGSEKGTSLAATRGKR